MARNVPSGTTAATAAQAATPAPQPKPATAALPAPSKPAAATAPAASRGAAPKAASAEEAEKARRRTAFEAESKAAQEESARDAATLSPYIEAIGRVQKLREESKIGAQPGPRMTERYPSMKPESSAYLTPDTSLYEKTARAYGQYAPPVTLPKDIGNLTQGQMASTARSVDLAYQAAQDEAASVGRAIQAAKTDPTKTPNDVKSLEAEKTRALRRVADLAASRREFGMATPATTEAQESALSPAPTVGPRTGGGKEYY